MEHFSFSQLLQYEQCPYSYYLARIANVPQKDNAFAQAGSLMHKLLHRWASGELSADILPEVWDSEFENTVSESFPSFMPQYRKLYRNKCRKYLERFDGFPGYEVIASEKQFSCSIAGHSFIGIIDLILQNMETGQYMIVDHKSTSSATLRKSRNEMYRQLLLYSRYIFDTCGLYPAQLQFNLFKEGMTDTRPFQQEAYADAIGWAEKQINEIKNRDIFDWLEARPDSFFCTELCGSREHCTRGNKYSSERRSCNDKNAVVRSA